LGAAAINTFSWVFYIFGLLLIWTAFGLARDTGHEQEHEEERENRIVTIVRRFLPTADQYDGSKLITKIDGKRYVTPLLLALIAIGFTDILFALDSIPAIYGLTQEPYIVFTANAFALMGLRQLYFLIGGLLDRLVYLSYGLAVVLGFIGVKLVLHACTKTPCRSSTAVSTSRSPRSQQCHRWPSSAPFWPSRQSPVCIGPGGTKRRMPPRTRLKSGRRRRTPTSRRLTAGGDPDGVVDG
jgi:TerC family integral membrane protein